MNAKTERTAKRFNVYDRILKLENELLNVEGNSKVDLFLDGLYDNLNQIVFHVKYVHVAIGGYFMLRNRFIKDILSVVSDNGLLGTEDDIEDYGDHFYFTTNCEKWLEQ